MLLAAGPKGLSSLQKVEVREITQLENKYAYYYKDNIETTYTDGTAPPNFTYDSDYGTYTYTGKSTKYVKKGTKFIGGATELLGDNKYNVYISPYSCDADIIMTYQHEIGHVALDLAKLTKIHYQESALYYRMYMLTGKVHYWNMYWHYGHTYDQRYGTIVNQIFR